MYTARTQVGSPGGLGNTEPSRNDDDGERGLQEIGAAMKGSVEEPSSTMEHSNNVDVDGRAEVNNADVGPPSV